MFTRPTFSWKLSCEEAGNTRQSVIDSVGFKPLSRVDIGLAVMSGAIILVLFTVACGIINGIATIVQSKATAYVLFGCGAIQAILQVAFAAMTLMNVGAF